MTINKTNIGKLLLTLLMFNTSSFASGLNGNATSGHTPNKTNKIDQAAKNTAGRANSSEQKTLDSKTQQNPAPHQRQNFLVLTLKLIVRQISNNYFLLIVSFRLK